MTTEVLRPHAEEEYATELGALAEADDRARPPAWGLSPAAGVTYRHGGGRGRHPRDRPGPVAARRTRDGVDLGE